MYPDCKRFKREKQNKTTKKSFSKINSILVKKSSVAVWLHPVVIALVCTIFKCSDIWFLGSDLKENIM